MDSKDKAVMDANAIFNSDKNEEELLEDPITWKIWQKRRYVVVIMAFFGFFNIYSLRVNLSVAIVAMTENRTIHHPEGNVTYEQYFPWTSTQSGLILSSFFYGYICTQLLGGYISMRIGGHRVFGIGIGTTAILTLFTPMAANAGFGVLLTTRVIMGLFEGVTFPCIHSIWSRWAPPLERSRMATLAYAGNYAGTVIAMSTCGVLTQSLGWESVFYIFGGIGVVWLILWVIIVREGPEDDRFISDHERRYITQRIGTSGRQTIVYPWKAMLTSKAVYAIIASHFSENWGFYTMLTQLPKFLKESMGFDLNNTGFLSALPYLVLGIFLGIAGYFADWFQVKGYLTTTQVRRYFNCLAFLAQTVFMVLVAIVLDPVYSVLFVTIAVGLGAFAWCGFAVNHLDIAPQYASMLMGISNTFATIPGIISPTLTGILVQNNEDSEWQTVFYISAGVYLIGCLIYWFWASGEIQPWALVSTNPDAENGHPLPIKSENGYENKAADLKDQ